MFDNLYNALTSSWQAQYCLRLVAAAFLGALIGLEREHHGRSAGFRTQMLVAMGSALAMVVSIHFADVYVGAGVNSALRVDPARVAYGVMGGIGFLGAGAIVKYGVNIRGMTTAASLWCNAAMGLACGFGMFSVAIASTALVLLALLVLNRVDKVITTDHYRTITVTARSNGVDNVDRFRSHLISQGVKVIDMEYTHDVQGGIETIRYYVKLHARGKSTRMNWFAGVEDILKVHVR